MLFVLAQHFVPSSWQSSVCQHGFELLKQPIDGLSQTTRQSQFQEKVPDSVLPHDEDPGWDGIEEELANITRPSKAAIRKAFLQKRDAATKTNVRKIPWLFYLSFDLGGGIKNTNLTDWLLRVFPNPQEC